MVLIDSDLHGLGQKPFLKAGQSHKRVKNHKLFNLFFGKLLDTRALGNLKVENMLLFLKNFLFFCEPLGKYIGISIYSNITMLFAGFLI